MNIDIEYKIKETSTLDNLDISTLISLSTDMVGTIGMSVSDKLAFSMIENFIFGEMTKEELTQLSSENVEETLNVILGNILSELDIVKNGGVVNISTPYTMNKPVTITKKKDGKIYLCKLNVNNETIILSYMIQSNKRKKMATVLIIDDAKIMRINLRKMLEEMGHEIVAEAENGYDAIEKYKVFKPDFVTMDITMPNINEVKMG